jgi:hypothetical protein
MLGPLERVNLNHWTTHVRNTNLQFNIIAKMTPDLIIVKQIFIRCMANDRNFVICIHTQCNSII